MNTPDELREQIFSKLIPADSGGMWQDYVADEILSLIQEREQAARHEMAMVIAPVNMPQAPVGGVGQVYWEMGFKDAGAIVSHASGMILMADTKETS